MADTQTGGDLAVRSFRVFTKFLLDQPPPGRLVEMATREVKLTRMRSLLGTSQTFADKFRPSRYAEFTADLHAVMAVENIAFLVIFDRHEHAACGYVGLQSCVILRRKWRQYLEVHLLVPHSWFPISSFSFIRCRRSNDRGSELHDHCFSIGRRSRCPLQTVRQ